MDNKNVNQNRDFTQGKEPKKTQTIGEKLERLGNKMARKNEGAEHPRESQR